MLRICLYFVVAVIYIGLSIMSGVYFATGKKGLAAFVFVSALATFNFYLMKRWRHDVVRPLASKSRPIVRVWTHDGDTVFTTDKIYRLSLELREQFLVMFPIDPHTIRITPLIYAVQRRREIGVSWISPEQAKAIFASCEVQRTEMQLPNPRAEAYFYRADFKKIWRLLHGPDAKPPELPKPTS